MLTDAIVSDAAPHRPPLVLPSPRFSAVAALAARTQPWGNAHDRASRDVLLSRIAALIGVPVRPPVGADSVETTDVLLVPGDTLTRTEAVAAGIARDEQILGGVVPETFVGTKAIAHGLIGDDATRPAAWSPALAVSLDGVTLRGFAAFSRADAMRAGEALFAAGPVRVKDVCGKAGLGQTVVRDIAALAALLALEDDDALAHCGIVLEENLADVITYSVGRVDLAGRRISYWGTQNLTTDHHGRDVYGGSDLFVVPGDFTDLAARPLPPAIARAVECAAMFDRAVELAYPDVWLTRRNYDVIEGTDATGSRKIGLLEQSWRVGGASGAELAAFEAFAADPALASVRCSTIERYALITPPPEATVYFHGEDPVVGAMTKFAIRTE